MKRFVLAAVVALLSTVGAVGAVTSSAAASPTARPAAHTAVRGPAVPTQWLSVTAAGETTCSIDTSRHLWCWGYNGYGQVGNGTFDDQASPVKIGGATWLSVRTAYYTTCGVRTDHTAWCWGYNVYGQTGTGSDDTYLTAPAKVAGSVVWDRFTPGYYNACGISTAGALYCSGYDGDGGIGDGPATDSSTNRPKRVGTSSGWGGVTVGYYNTCAVKTDHSGYCWGDGGMRRQRRRHHRRPVHPEAAARPLGPDQHHRHDRVRDQHQRRLEVLGPERRRRGRHRQQQPHLRADAHGAGDAVAQLQPDDRRGPRRPVASPSPRPRCSASATTASTSSATAPTPAAPSRCPAPARSCAGR